MAWFALAAHPLRGHRRVRRPRCFTRSRSAAPANVAFALVHVRFGRVVRVAVARDRVTRVLAPLLGPASADRTPDLARHYGRAVLGRPLAIARIQFLDSFILIVLP